MVGLTRLPVMFVALSPDAPPVIPPVTIGADQLYTVPAGTIPLVIFVGVTVKLTPSQLTAVIAVIVAFGFKVSVNWNDAPVQPFVIGVTV